MFYLVNSNLEIYAYYYLFILKFCLHTYSMVNIDYVNAKYTKLI